MGLYPPDSPLGKQFSAQERVMASKALRYAFFASEFGWTPEEVDRQDAEKLVMIQAALEGKAEKRAADDAVMGRRTSRKLKREFGSG